ncbi:MAG: proline dehydrogenase family protein [Fimbriimonas ginsengisoli]|uniref:proline dehydrogenase n=1 Tax=Fimbriimonas ginsengisoli TaxID=1005039 RepID=A0A931LV08_FIMGI|nr:proline dehydrogenase family protein [Fimbriimonas ginsengisoli]MBI3722218.1 proline dehydrogenase family protein [Fimbriimonas ginsengisoli]
MFARLMILKASEMRPVRKMITQSRAFRPLIRRFVAGETLDQAIAAAEELLPKGIYVSLDYLGENVQSREEAVHAKNTYIEILKRIAAIKEVMPMDHVGYADGLVETVNLSVKLTQCGLDQSDDFAEENYREVLAVAKAIGNFVRVDMEGSPYTERTVKLVERVHVDYPNTGTVLQSYLYRTTEDVEWAAMRRLRIRLVKGAYFEEADVAYQEKMRVDEAYMRLAERMLEACAYPAFATHDEALIEKIQRSAKALNLPKDRFEFQMLFGVRRDLQEKLVAEGHRMRVYIPYGESWYPYFSRRLAERPANALFALKSLFKG